MSQSRYNRRFKPKRANGAKGLIFTRVHRCNSCGVQHKSKPVQCYCGSITFTKFDSMAEANRYATLLLLVDRGRISSLKTQVRIPLKTTGPNGLSVIVGHYIADFEYDDHEGKRVIEDVKGLITDLASWKLRHVKAQYGIDVLLTKGN